MDRIDDKWRSVFPELKDDQEVESFFEYYIDENWMCDKQIIKYWKFDIDKTHILRIEKVIDEECPFRTFICFALSQFYNELEDTVKKYKDIVEVGKVIDDLLRYIGKKLLDIVIHTMIEEIHECEKENKLLGDTEESRYNYYDEELSISPQYIYELEEKYPVLFDLINKLIGDQIEYVKDLLEHISVNREHIARLLRTNSLGKVQSIQFGLGDSHCGGKTVVQISFQEGEVIYKPRNLRMEEGWNNLVDFVNRKNGKQVLKAAKIVCGIDYGFMEKVLYSKCKDEKEVEDFFYHSGCLLAVLYSLNASDCHFENIISMRNYPVIVDAELLLGINPNGYKCDNKSVAKAINALYYSVSRVGLLPFEISYGKTKIDIGGISDVNNKSLIKSQVLRNKGTVRIHFEYEECELRQKGNVPKLMGQVGKNRCLECMVIGFEEIYNLILEYKDEYIKTVISSFGSSKTRVLYNPTMIYGHLLGISYYPMFMRSRSDRVRLLSRIALANREHRKLVQSEMNMLISNDIPYYFINFNESSITDGRGTVIKADCVLSPCDMFLEKMSWLSERDKWLQKEILIDSFYSFDYCDNMTGFKWSNCLKLNQEDIVKRNMLNTAEEILDYLYQIRSFVGVNSSGVKERCFVGSTILNMDKDNWRKDLLDLDLYDGHIGLVYLYFYAAKYMGSDKYREIAKEILCMLQQNYQLFTERQNVLTGLHKGLGGFLVTISEYYKEMEQESLEFMKLCMQRGLDAMDKNNSIDLIGGNVGLVLAALYVEERVHDNEIENLVADIVKKARDIMLGNLEEMYAQFSGYAHGLASLIVVLYRIYLYLKDPLVMELIEKLIQYDRETFFDRDKHDWYRAKEDKSFSRGWCHGSPGILLGRIQLKKMGYTDQYLDQEIEWLIENVKNESFGYNLSYCHGDLGNLSILKQVAVINEDKELMELVNANFQKLYKLAVIDWKQMNRPIHKLNGLMAGLGGIAFALINFAMDDKEPAFISLV